MTTAAKISHKTDGVEKQTLLPLPKGGKFSQKDISGKNVLKETLDPKIQEAGNYWLGKKYHSVDAQEKEAKAATDFLKMLERLKKTSVVIFDSEKNCKRRVNVKQGSVHLSLTKAGVND